MATAIWKDYYVNLGTDDSYVFRIISEGAGVYQGIAHKRPGDDNVYVKINDLCADYLQQKSGIVNDELFVSDIASRQFVLQKQTSSGGWQFVLAEIFYNDWSYDAYTDVTTGSMSFPINGRIVNGMPVVLSVFQPTDFKVLLDGDLIGIVNPGSNTPCTCYYPVQDASPGVEVMIADDVSQASLRYTVVDSCARYALYYKNAYGGTDLFLIEGNHSETDDLTRYTRAQEYDNVADGSRGRKNYVNEIRKSLTLHSSWLSDDESSRMHHLLNSTEVCLFDIIKGEMIPVLLKNTTTEYKTFKGNGGKLVNYSIEVEFANDMVRR